MLLLTLPLAGTAAATDTSKTYYINSALGSDENDGLSPDTPFLSAAKISALSLAPGDSVLFKKGCTFICENLTLTISGTKEKPIVISSYGEGEKPRLTALGNTEVLRLFDCSFVTVSSLEITAPTGGGIWIDTLEKKSDGITLTDLTMHDITNTTATARDNLSYGAAVARACVMVKGLPARSRYPVDNLKITNCEMYDCGNGISCWGSWNDEQAPWCDEEDIDPIFNSGFYVGDCYFHNMDEEALIIGMCDGAVCENSRCIDCCYNDGVNDDGTSFVAAAMWFWGSVNSTIRRCEIAGQRNLGDGMTCDFDSYSHYCTYEYIYSHDNVRFVNNCPQHSGHRGNTIRYCLSVNDNKRASNLSQYCYDSNEYGLRFYGNTIINPNEYIIEGVRDGYIADNIFYGDFTASFRWSRKKVNDETNEKFMDEFTGVMTNNCFFGTCVPSCSVNNLICDPCFVGTDLTNPRSFILSSSSPLLGKGITYSEGETDMFQNVIGKSTNLGFWQGEDKIEREKTSFLTSLIKYISTFFAKAYQWIVDCNNRYWLF